jgi:hypothetical protein
MSQIPATGRVHIRWDWLSHHVAITPWWQKLVNECECWPCASRYTRRASHVTSRAARDTLPWPTLHTWPCVSIARADRQTGSQTYRQAGKQADRQTSREKMGPAIALDRPTKSHPVTPTPWYEPSVSATLPDPWSSNNGKWLSGPCQPINLNLYLNTWSSAPLKTATQTQTYPGSERGNGRWSLWRIIILSTLQTTIIRFSDLHIGSGVLALDNWRPVG